MLATPDATIKSPFLELCLEDVPIRLWLEDPKICAVEAAGWRGR